MTESTPAAQDPGLFARFIGVITSPKATFQTVVAHPKAVRHPVCRRVDHRRSPPAAPQFTETGRQAALDMKVQQMERFGRPVTDEMYAADGAAERNSAPTRTVISQFIFMPIWRWSSPGCSGCLQRHARRHGDVQTGAGGGDPLDGHHGARCGDCGADSARAGQMTMTGPFNLGVLVPMLDENSFISRFLGGINVFTLWDTVVVAIGLGVLYRRKTAQHRHRTADRLRHRRGRRLIVGVQRSQVVGQALQVTNETKEKDRHRPGRRRRPGRHRVRQPGLQADDGRRRSPSRRSRRRDLEAHRLGQRQDPAEEDRQHQRGDDGQGRERSRSTKADGEARASCCCRSTRATSRRRCRTARRAWRAARRSSSRRRASRSRTRRSR